MSGKPNTQTQTFPLRFEKMQSFTLWVDVALGLDYVLYALNNNEMSFGPFEKLEFFETMDCLL